ncbi:MAG: transcriptional regulator, tetR family protein [Solirubrobacterales bacterium]|nr:transcriptional regulator, tetR family protein [Solirubrobacterales bacterium]
MNTAPTSRAVAAEATRARLIDVAITRFAADGLETSFDLVAADAGVSKGALYHHFASKQGLVDAVYREAIQRHAARVVAASSTGTGRERLLGLVSSSIELYSSSTPFYQLLSRLHDAGSRSPSLAAISERSQRNQLDYFTAAVERGQRDGSIRTGLDPEALALLVRASVLGLLVPPRVSPQLLSRFTTLLEDLLQ